MEEQNLQNHVEIQIHQSPAPQVQQQDQKLQPNPPFSDGDFEFVSMNKRLSSIIMLSEYIKKILDKNNFICIVHSHF